MATSTNTKKQAIDPKQAAKEALERVRAEELAKLAESQNMPADVKNKIEAIKKKLDKFKTSILKKYDKQVMGITLLPPSKDPKEQEKIKVLILIDDKDVKDVDKFKLKDKIVPEIKKVAEGIDKNMEPDTVLLSEVWQACYDQKTEILQTISASAPVHDNGMLSAIKISEVHKTMVLKKFEKYIVSYVLAGSLVQGKATPDSDIDVFIVIDDTDVKKMSRTELREKLRSIILSMGFEAGRITGVENKINIQVYILTDFWEYIKEANPVIFTFLRDGVPFYDRGIFMPWKQLLKMGKIKPSPEAIDMFMHTGDSMLDRIKYKLRDMGMEDFFLATLTPTQAALMMYGVPPPTPKEAPSTLRDIFVKKEKMLEERYVKILEKIIKTRKDLEHGDKKSITGKEIDQLLADAQSFLKRLKELFTQIEQKRDKERVLHNYENMLTMVRDVMKVEGITTEVSDTNLTAEFDKKLVKTGIIPQRFTRILKDIVKAKRDYDSNKLTKNEIQLSNKQTTQLVRFIVEHIQKKRGKELERTKIRVKYGKKFGEVYLLDNQAFIVHDIDAEQKEITHGSITKDGKLTTERKSNLEELENALMKVDIPAKVFVKQPIFNDLKRIFGEDVEILVNY